MRRISSAAVAALGLALLGGALLTRPSAAQPRPDTAQLNVAAFGARGDGSADDGPAIQAAIDAAANGGGGTILLAPGTYLLGNPLLVRSGTTLRGAGIDATVLRDHKNLGSRRLLSLKGTPAARTDRVRISGITFRNGTARPTAAVGGKDAIRAEQVDNVLIEDCKFTEIEGGYCLALQAARNVTVLRCHFYRFTAVGLQVLVDCENVRVLDNSFDTVVSSAAKSSYALSVAGESQGEGSFFVKNLWVQRNTIRNNPLWQGIELWGGENVWIENNYVEACKTGIAALAKEGYVLNPLLRNVYIRTNQLLRGAAAPESAGIHVVGVAPGALAENIHIDGNTVTGYGDRTKGSRTGSITLRAARGVEITGNAVDQYSTAAICLSRDVTDCAIVRNKIGDMASAADALGVAILLGGQALYGIGVHENSVQPTARDGAPSVLLSATHYGISVQLSQNTATDLTTPFPYIGGGLPLEQAPGVVPKVLIQKYGDMIWASGGKANRSVTAPRIGYGTTNRDVIVKVSMSPDSNVATIVENGKSGNKAYPTYDYLWLPDGMNVIVAGAAGEGKDLTARVIRNDGKTLTLNTRAAVAVKNASLTCAPLLLTP